LRADCLITRKKESETDKTVHAGGKYPGFKTMTKIKNEKIILCQPDSKKGCSACCGLFNHIDISRKALSSYLSDGIRRVSLATRNSMIEDFVKISQDVRDLTSHICPYQGFIHGENPGCLIHPLVNGKDLRDLSLFGKKICGDFLCPAHKFFDEDTKTELIASIDDWYLYTVAIIDPLSYLWIRNLIRDHQAMEKSMSNIVFSSLITAGLQIHAEHMARKQVSLFYYSMSEYKLYNKDFSLSDNSESAEKEKNLIREKIDSIINQKIRV